MYSYGNILYDHSKIKRLSSFRIQGEIDIHWTILLGSSLLLNAGTSDLERVLIHLYEWHQLLIKFVEHNMAEESKIAFLPTEYSWKTYGEMNVMLWNRHQGTDFESAKKMLEESHKKVMEMASGFTNEELFTKKYYNWTGTTDLGAYFVSTCSSHYEWAIKKIKAHCKKVK